MTMTTMTMTMRVENCDVRTVLHSCNVIKCTSWHEWILFYKSIISVSFYFFSEEGSGLAGGMQRNPELMQVNPELMIVNWIGMDWLDWIVLGWICLDCMRLDLIWRDWIKLAVTGDPEEHQGHCQHACQDGGWGGGWGGAVHVWVSHLQSHSGEFYCQ